MILIDPQMVMPPHKVTRPEDVDSLADDMLARGWHGAALVGYVLHDRIQLLSGTHRRSAAIKAGLPVPVVVHPLEAVESAWGTEQWAVLMASGDR